MHAHKIYATGWATSATSPQKTFSVQFGKIWLNMEKIWKKQVATLIGLAGNIAACCILANHFEHINCQACLVQKFSFPWGSEP